MEDKLFCLFLGLVSLCLSTILVSAAVMVVYAAYKAVGF